MSVHQQTTVQPTRLIIVEHLAHRLPWGNLTQILLRRPPINVPNAPVQRWRIPIDLREKKMVDHFARCFAAAVQEFRESDRSSDTEKEIYDPRTWPGQREHAIGAWAGFFDSLVNGYIQLNVILSHLDKFVPHELAEHLQQAFDGDKLKALTAQGMQILRDHAAMMFRCMYSISGVNDFVEPKWIIREILSGCGLDYFEESEE